MYIFVGPPANNYVVLCRIMFDEVAEEQLRRTDLAERLNAAIDGPDRWIRLSLPRAVARNIVYKLERPALRPYLGTGTEGLRNTLREFYVSFPALPERYSSVARQRGLRGDDPMVRFAQDCIRFQKIFIRFQTQDPIARLHDC